MTIKEDLEIMWPACDIIYHTVIEEALENAPKNSKGINASHLEIEKKAHDLSEAAFKELEKQIREIEPKDFSPQTREKFLRAAKKKFYSSHGGIPKLIKQIILGEIRVDDVDFKHI